MSVTDVTTVQTIAQQLRSEADPMIVEAALNNLADVALRDPQPVIAGESVLQLVITTLAKSSTTDAGRLAAADIMFRVLLRGHNGFAALRPHGALTPLLAQITHTFQPLALRAAFASVLLITNEVAPETMVDEASVHMNALVNLLAEWVVTALETDSAQHDDVDVVLRLFLFLASQEEQTTMLENGAFGVLKFLLASIEEPRIAAGLAIMMQCTDEACRDAFRLAGAVQLLPALLSSQMAHIVRMTAVTIGNITDDLNAVEFLPALPKLLKMLEGKDNAAQVTAALFALSKLSQYDDVNNALVKLDAVSGLQDIYTQSPSYDARQLAGVIVYNLYFTLQQIPSAIVQARLAALHQTNTTRCMQKVYEVTALFRLVFRAHSAHGRMPRALCHTVIGDLCARTPSDQQFASMYSRVGTREDALDFDRFIFLLYQCSASRMLVKTASLEGDVPLPRAGGSGSVYIRVRLTVPHDLIAEAFANIPALFALFDADGDNQFNADDFIRGLVVLTGVEPSHTVVGKFFDSQRFWCKMEDFFALLRVFFEYLEQSWRSPSIGTASAKTPPSGAAPTPTLPPVDMGDAVDDDVSTAEALPHPLATPPRPLAHPLEQMPSSPGPAHTQSAQAVRGAMALATSLAFGAGALEAMEPVKTGPVNVNAGTRGYLLMSDGRETNQWKKRWFALEGKMLGLYKDQTMSKAAQDSVMLKLTDCVVTFAPEKGKKNCFKVLFPDFSNGMRVLYLCSETSDEMQLWMRGLQKSSQVK